MLRRGKIILTTLGPQPEIHEGNESEDWVREVLLAAAPDAELTGLSAEEWAAQSKLKIRVEIAKLAGGEDYSFSGNLEAVVPTVCARCATLLNVTRSSEFHLYIKLVDRFRNAEDLDSGDPDLIYIGNPEFDIREPLTEQLVILEPFAEVPEADYQGNPHICSNSLEIQAGQDVALEASSPFAKLASLKD
jgi:uncharacterized metal-binding protein YceD (DUF177 family)